MKTYLCDSDGHVPAHNAQDHWFDPCRVIYTHLLLFVHKFHYNTFILLCKQATPISPKLSPPGLSRVCSCFSCTFLVFPKKFPQVKGLDVIQGRRPKNKVSITVSS